MVFSNLTFLYLFLPLNLLLYFIGKNTTWRNGVLTAFSLFFYAWGEPVFVLLLLFSAAANYGFGLAIARYKGDSPKCRLLLASSVAVNLGLLAFFKYSAFLVANLNALLGTSIPAPAVALPIGISFYTFQILSYVIDVYRGEVAAQRSFLKLLMYVSMYPQLVAGPIVRYSHIAEEIENRAVTWDSFSRGITRFCFGLFKKVVVANYAGQLASSYLDGDLSQLSTPGAWLGLLLFTLQIYYDFSAYSDMAIGLGQMFGFHYRENFDYPYISCSVTEFWRRWHISLGSFFRDYLYIPLGGNRFHPLRNLLIVWFFTGLWHGASWNFILWGLYFGCFIALERYVWGGLLKRLPRAVSWAYSMFLVMLGWGLFYFTDLGRLATFFRALFAGVGTDLPVLGVVVMNNILWLILAMIFCMPVTRLCSRLVPRGSPKWGGALLEWGQIAVNLGMLLVSTAFLVGQSYNPFLYFRF